MEASDSLCGPPEPVSVDGGGGGRCDPTATTTWLLDLAVLALDGAFRCWRTAVSVGAGSLRRPALWSPADGLSSRQHRPLQRFQSGPHRIGVVGVECTLDRR